MAGRVGNPELRSNSGNISGIEAGDTRDIAAAKAGLMVEIFPPLHTDGKT